MATATTTVPRKKKRKVSRVWWHVHQWVGLKLAILMSFICLAARLSSDPHVTGFEIRPQQA